MMRRHRNTVGVALALVAGAFSLAHGQAAAVEDFDAAWEAIRDTHFDPNLNGVDWDAVRDELRPAAAEASRSEGRGIILEMLGRLGQSHFTLLPKGGGGVTPFGDGAHAAPMILETPEPTAPQSELKNAEDEHEWGDASPGFEVRLIGDDVVVVRVRPGSAAERVGVRPGWSLLAIGTTEVGPVIVDQVESMGRRTGTMYVWQIVTAMLTGAEGSHTRLVFLDGEGEEQPLTVEREAPVEPAVAFAGLPAMSPGFEHRWIEASDLGLVGEARIGYLEFDVWLQTIPRQFDAAMLEFADADGVVIDLRGNVGGIGALAMMVGRYLVDEPASLGTMRMRNQTLHFNLQPVMVSMEGEDLDPYAGPVAILIDSGSASTSEIFAAGIQELGRARLFGERTPGLALPAMLTELPGGDVLMHAMAGFETPGGVSMEEAGVTPDVLAPWDRESLLAGHDDALDAAAQWIINGKE
ncbi:MAG: carboxyl-terminal processing protease [Phycisphaerales bacterium]|jgi:carboxyl-terminal processing protease